MIKKNIFIISNEPWGDIWFSKHHYANELAKLDQLVYFINSPTYWSPKHLFYWKIKKTKIKNNLWVVDYYNPFPLRLFPKVFVFLNDYFNRWKFRGELKYSKKSIMWSFDPLRFVFYPLTENIIYHVADPYMSLKATAPYDPILSKKAELLICTSPLYEAYYKKKGCENILFIPHQISNTEYNLDHVKIDVIRNKFGKFILFIGSINDDVNLDLFEEINKEINTNFLFIGSDNSNLVSQIIKFKNRFHYLGVVHASNLKNYIAASSVCITIYKFGLNKGIGSRSPLKVLNYLSQFKPIVTTIDSEISELENKAIYRANTKDEFILLLNKGLNDELFVDKNAVKKYLSDHTYQKAIHKIFTSLDNR